MAETAETENPSSKNGSTQIWTLYDLYQHQLSLSSESQDKSSKGNYLFGKLRPGSSTKSKKQEGSTTAQPPQEAAVDGSNGCPTRNNSGEGSSSKKKQFDKKYEYPRGVRGFTKDEMSLEIMLLQDGKDDIKKIGVVGLPGVGKTTLCKFIQKQNERVKDRYQIEWISLLAKKGDTDDIVDLDLDSTADALSKKLIESDEKPDEKKYLIVIDDVDEAGNDGYYVNLKKCIDELPEGNLGAVIVICRSEEKAMKVVGDRYLHRLQPLNDPDKCWWIYNEAVKGKELEENEGRISKEVKEELMKRCGGLPGAARMLGQIKAQQLLREVEEKNRANQNNNTAGS